MAKQAELTDAGKILWGAIRILAAALLLVAVALVAMPCGNHTESQHFESQSR